MNSSSNVILIISSLQKSGDKLNQQRVAREKLLGSPNEKNQLKFYYPVCDPHKEEINKIIKKGKPTVVVFDNCKSDTVIGLSESIAKKTTKKEVIFYHKDTRGFVEEETPTKITKINSLSDISLCLEEK